MKRGGATLRLAVLAAALLAALLVASSGLVRGPGRREGRASVDEFLATLYLTELTSQVASLPPASIPLAQSPLDLTTAVPGLRLAPDDPGTALHLSPLRRGFVRRTLCVVEVAGPRGALREVRGAVTYEVPGGSPRSLDLVTWVGRGRMPSAVEGGRSP